MRFFTLIHICKTEQSLHNNAFGTSFKDQISLYFSCAKQLHLSLKAVGIELVVITNDKAFLLGAAKNDYEIEIREMNFEMEVPSGLKFYSAHYKIEVYKYLNSLTDDYIGLIDCDILCVNPIPQSLHNVVEYKIPLIYDITDQVFPAYGQNRVINDKQKVTKTNSIGLWTGGEFIAGPPDFFGKLYAHIIKIKDEYFNNCHSLHHQSDEVLTSIAIENMIIQENLVIMDAGSLSIIGRFWSPRTLHIQKPFNAYYQHFLIHLPSDKKFIVQLKANELRGEEFFKVYRSHLIKSRIIENVFRGIKPYVKRARKRLSV